MLCRPGWEKKFPKAVVETSPYNQKEIDNLQINYSGLDKSLASIKKFRVLLAEAGAGNPACSPTESEKEGSEWTRKGTCAG